VFLFVYIPSDETSDETKYLQVVYHTYNGHLCSILREHCYWQR